MKKNIRTQMIFFSSLLILTLLIFQIVFSIFSSKTFFENSIKKGIEQVFSLIEENYTDDKENLYNLSKKYSDKYNLEIIIWKDNGLVYSNKNIDFSHGFSKGHGGHSNEFLREDAIVKKILYKGSERYISITSPVEYVNETVEIFIKSNILISFLVLILGVLTSYIFSKRFSMPIKNIQKVAEQVAELKFELKADTNISTKELSELSSSINTMSEKLESLISDLKNANEKLKEDIENQLKLEKMRREFIANVSHELKTPLHLLLMYAEGLKNNIEQIDKDYYCETIIEEVLTLNKMVSSLLDLSSVENGLSKMTMEDLNLSKLAYDVFEKYYTINKNLEKNLEKKIYILGNEGYLEQAMENYISNAIYHSELNTKIKISLEIKEDKAYFSVLNFGEPIKEKDLEQLWESFYRADKSKVKEDESHTGLGLYIVKTIIAAHNGTYGAINKENTVTFWFSIPLKK